VVGMELGTVLGIWAHPDDEAYLSGGLMSLARGAGSRVVCVTATRGELGTPDPETWPPERLAAARTVELARCLGILGVTEHRWLDYADGACAEAAVDKAVERVCDLIDEVRPDTVVTFGPDGFTGHADHRAVSGWATTAFAKAAGRDARLLYAAAPQRRTRRWGELYSRLSVFEEGYPVWVPDSALALDLRLDRRTVTRKVRALAAQTTQTADLIGMLGVETYTAWVAEESFVAASGPAVDCR